MANLNYFLWLTTRPGFQPAEYKKLLDYFETPEKIYFACEQDYEPFAFSARKRASLADKDMRSVEKILEDCDRKKIQILTIQDSGYPSRLKEIYDPPCVLYYKGHALRIDSTLTIGVVGTRSCTPYGVQMAGQLALELAHAGVTLVSGIAEGVDTAALRGALRGGGTVISVLGGGIDIHYPKANAFLYEDIATVGTLVSEYPPGTPPSGRNFPVRNRILSGLSMGIVVAEAPESSGALITARLALEQNREVFAFPGPANASASLGANRLIQRGEAKLVLSVSDVLAEFTYLLPRKGTEKPPLPAAEAQSRLQASKQSTKPNPKAPERKRKEKEVDKEPGRAYISLAESPGLFQEDERDVLLALAERDLNADDLAEATQLPTSRVLTALTMLQINAHVEERPGKRYHALVLLKA